VYLILYESYLKIRKIFKKKDGKLNKNIYLSIILHKNIKAKKLFGDLEMISL
jgi:hypothetical protein